MPRYKFTVEYDGTDLVGWQRQDNGLSVQEIIEKAAGKLAPRQKEIVVHAAGRTDAGVHALGQAAHIDLDEEIRPDKVRDGLNAYIRPHRVSILTSELVDDEFHARFSAKERAYQYRILNRRGAAALDKGRVWEIRQPLDVEAMHEAAQVLVGNHDFTSFRATVCQANTPVKTLDLVNVRRVGEEIHVDVRARSFLHHMVRNIVGTLKLVGEVNGQKKTSKPPLKPATAAPEAPPHRLTGSI